MSAALWLAVSLAMGVTILTSVALRARSLLATIVCLAGAGAMTAATLVMLDADDGALAIAVVGVGVAPFLLLGGVLLSVRTAKSTGLRTLWPSVIALALGVAAAVALAPELPMTGPASGGRVDPIWLAAIVFASSSAAAALIGFGERGVLERRDHERVR